MKKIKFEKNGKIFNLKAVVCENEYLIKFMNRDYFYDLCKGECPNFNKNWSCPPNSPRFDEFVKDYLTIENSTGNEDEIKPIFYYLICKLIKGNENILKELLSLIIQMCSITQNNPDYIDLICADCSFVLSACAKFKFYITVLGSKVKQYYKVYP